MLHTFGGTACRLVVQSLLGAVMVLRMYHNRT